MFIYDPQRDISQWVPVRGTSSTLTLSELRAANDLNNMNPFPYDMMELVQPHQQHSPMLVPGFPMGEESDTDSFEEPVDLGDEWDKTECGNWLHCPSLPPGKGPTWAEATTESWRKIIWGEDTPLLQEMLSHSLHKDTEKEDSNWDEETHRSAESQFEDAATADKTCMDTVEESTAEAPLTENIVEALTTENITEASVGPGSQDIVQIHTGNDDDLE